MNICCLLSLKHLGASTCTNIAFSKISDISCVSQLLSENLEKEGCTLLIVNRSTFGKDLHLPSLQGQALLTLLGTSGLCPVTNKTCQQNHSTQCRSSTTEFTSPELRWRRSQSMYIRTGEARLGDGDGDLKFLRWDLQSHSLTTHLSHWAWWTDSICTEMLTPPGTISIKGTSPGIYLV